MTEIVKKPSLATYAMEVERLCALIDDNHDAELPLDLIQLFDEARGGLVAKSDAWIGVLTAVKYRAAQLKEQAEAYKKAQKSAEKLEERMHDYIKQVMTEFPQVPFRGSTGKICLQANSAAALVIDFDVGQKVLYKVVDIAQTAVCSGLSDYVEMVSHFVIDTARLKSDVESGKEFTWCRLKRGEHVRIRI